MKTNLAVALAASLSAIFTFCAKAQDFTANQRVHYSVAVTPGQNTLVMSNRNVLRVEGTVVNNGPSDGWVSRSDSTTSNGWLLVVGGSFETLRPLVSNGALYFKDNGPVYFWSTNATTISTGEALSR